MTERNEHTSAQVAQWAAIGLQNPKHLTAEQLRAVCASALTQAPAKKKFLGIF